MVPLALTAIAAGASAAALLVLRHRRGRRSAALGRGTPLPAGVQHLAATMTDLSDMGLHLHAQRAAQRKARLGGLLLR